jgi:hypothetical protein
MYLDRHLEGETERYEVYIGKRKDTTATSEVTRTTEQMRNAICGARLRHSFEKKPTR